MIAFLSLAQFFPSPAHAVAYGVLVAGVIELAFIVWAAARTGLALRFGLPRWNAEMRDFMSALGAAMIGAGSVEIGLFMDTLIASFLPAGDLTALYYADRINQLPMGIVGVAHRNRAAARDVGEARAQRREGRQHRAEPRRRARAPADAPLHRGLLSSFPTSLMRALFVRGAFSVDAADQAAAALSAYALGLPAFVLLALRDARLSMRAATPRRPCAPPSPAVAANIAMKFGS